MTDPLPAPTGTVTCLFSDIEGSTKLELALGTAVYAGILGRHRTLLRDAFASHQGVEQGTEGDSFFVIFASAIDAVVAAADAQRSLASEAWPDGVDVRVRMGLHTGEIERLGVDVVGYAINRTARIAAAAHGGQVLLSDTTRSLVADELPAGITLRDLGQHRLKDLRAPERLTQLVIDGLGADFATPRSIDAKPNNLPTQLTSFVGRERELAEAWQLLAGTRLLTFTGPGGTGKTRLSLQVAAAASDAYPDGVWFVPLEAVRDPTLVAPTIARAIGLADNMDRPATDAIVEAIGDGRVLVVLDNFEQVVDAGPVVAELLRRSPGLTALVTTRVALRVSGEQEYPVPGLPAPPDTRHLSEMERLNLPRGVLDGDLETVRTYEAVRLFISRATSVKPGFGLTSTNASAVAAICATLHGMPLAIELAAARIKLLTPDQILARLEHHLDLLTAGSRDLPERQQTLRGAIAWSYDLLDDGSRRLVDRLSVFRGGFQLEMAEIVCGPAAEVGGDVLDRIGELVDQSLVRMDEEPAEPRFGMLETIREYAAEMLEIRGETGEIQGRHALALLDLAERAAPELSGDDQRAWLDRLEAEHDNLRAVLDRTAAEPRPEVATRLAFALWRFWQQRGYLKEARARFDAMAAQDWPLEPELRARFAEAFGGIAYWQSDEVAATRWYDEALAVWRSIGDKREIANALFNRAYADLVVIMAGKERADRHAEGLTKLEEALSLYREIGDDAGEGNVLWGLGSYHYFSSDAATAEEWYRRSLELHRSSHQRTMEAWSLHMLGLALVGQHRFDEAIESAEHALRHFHEAGDVAGVTLVLDDLAIIAANTGDPDRGAQLWGAARHLQQTTGTTLANYVDEENRLFGVPTPREMLSPEDLAARAAEGAAMSLDELVAFALRADVVPTVPHDDPVP